MERTWSAIFRTTAYRGEGWWQNLIVGVVLILITQGLGSTMSGKRGVILGVAIGTTVIVWIVALIMISNVTDPVVEPPKTVPGPRFQELREPTPNPRFQEKPPTEVSFSLGTGGAAVIYSYARLLKGPMNPFKTLIPFATPGFNPQFYIEDSKILMDVVIYDSILMSPIEIKHNQFVVRRPHWDKNSNEHALEVVNENKVPVLQVIYSTESQIVMMGSSLSRGA